MYLIHKMTALPSTDIGKEFERNHTTVLHAVKSIEEKLSNAASGLEDNIRDITSNINSRL